ncbi:MAG: hypothetical protein LLG16_08610 [Euryarchaeota archaeon]|nr:hypothetical protein [Euryarchaeota archaeon]
MRVDANNDGAISDGDYLLIHLDEYVVGAWYSIKMYISTIITSGVEFTLMEL